MIPQFLQEIYWDCRKVCFVREAGGFTTLVPLHLYPFTSFPLERCCKRSSELLEMDQVHLFSSFFSNDFQILGIILK